MSIAEIIALIRDIVFLVATLVAVLVLLLAYRKISAILNSAKRTISDAEDIASTVANRVVGPTMAGSGVALGAWKIAALLFRLTQRKEGSKGDEE